MLASLSRCSWVIGMGRLVVLVVVVVRGVLVVVVLGSRLRGSRLNEENEAQMNWLLETKRKRLRGAINLCKFI